MITLCKLFPPENQTLFDRYRELNSIWEVEVLQYQARESYEEWNENPDTDQTGEVFAIHENDIPIGIIGWFEFGHLPDTLRLRYYGIVPSKRGNRYGEQAMRMFLAHLSRHAPEQYVFAGESISLGRSAASKIYTHFKNMGFEDFSDPTYGDNGFGEVQHLRIRIPGR